MKFGRTIVLTVALVLFGSWVYADECNTVRYSDNGDGTITDCRTGLIWLKDANCLDGLSLPGIDKSQGYLDWYDAMTWVKALSDGHCELTDGSFAGEWRLPTITEWRAMIASAKKQGFTNPILTNAAGTAKWTNDDVFTNVQSVRYWSSTTDAGNADYAWLVHLFGGGVYDDDKTYNSYNVYVWPVRGGQSGSFGNLIIE
jgi:hypothetical protein